LIPRRPRSGKKAKTIVCGWVSSVAIQWTCRPRHNGNMPPVIVGSTYNSLRIRGAWTMDVISPVMKTPTYISLDSSPRIHWVYMIWRVMPPTGSTTGMTLVTTGIRLLITHKVQLQAPRRFVEDQTTLSRVGSLRIQFDAGQISQSRTDIIQEPVSAVLFNMIKRFN